MAHLRASRPKPCPGSCTTLTVSGEPSDFTFTWITTKAWSICSASASPGKGQSFQSTEPSRPGARDLSSFRGGAVPGPVPVPPGVPVFAAAGLYTAVFDVPSDDV